MATINKIVNKTLVNGSEAFVYTFNISYSGLTNPTAVGKVVDFFPNKIKFTLPPIGGALQSIDVLPVSGGRNVVFNFGSVNAGTSISFTMACYFGNGRVDNDSFINTAQLFADSTVVATATAPIVKLVLDENFTASKSYNKTQPVKPNEQVTFVIIITNTNDPGAKITNIEISDLMPPQLIPLTAFLPIGNDVSSFEFNDPTYNGRTGSWSGNTMNFTLPSYNGTAYEISFKATVAPTVVAGETIINTAKWSVNGMARPDATLIFKVYKDEAAGYFTKAAPLYAAIGQPIQYSARFTNTGTVDLSNVTVTDILPSEINITKISGRADGIVATDKYSLYVETSDSLGSYKVVATDVVGNSSVYDLTALIPVGQRVVSVRMITNKIKPFNVVTSIEMQGLVSATATPNKVITNSATLVANSNIGAINYTSLANTTLNGRSLLNISKSLVPSLPAYNPLSEFFIKLTSFNTSGMVFEPVFADLLPLGIEYAPNGTDYFTYFSVLSGISYDSRQPDYPYPLPIKEVIRNYNNSGRTLVRFRFNGMNIQFYDIMNVFFTVFATLNPPSSFSNTGYLGNPGSNAQVFNSTAYTDIADFDGDTITTEQIAQSNIVNGNILSTSEFSLEKWAKGNLETDFSKATTVAAGGDIIYNLNVTNNQDIDLKNIQLIDILPYVGDTGVILNTTPRGSQFNVYAKSEVSAKIINVLGNFVNPNPIILIEYSTSSDPIRFNETGTGTIGTGSWSLAPPLDITTLRSVKITTDPSIVLKPYERLVVSINAKTPVGAVVGALAYNSYAVKADKIVGGAVSAMNPAEPNKVSAKIAATALSSIGQFVWEDLNGNGIFETGEPRVNGVIVQLYNNLMQLMATTVTANDQLGNAGYYNFTNLKAATYFLKFLPPQGFALTVQNTVNPNGSRPSAVTGLTNAIVLGERTVLTDINAGLQTEPCTAPVIIATNKCLNINETFNPLTGVTATDCKGTDITVKIIVKANDVDTSKEGIYYVTYSVTDKKGQETLKTIIVKVCKKSNMTQAISDIIQSIALEQAALSHIINAEGEKIQRAIALNFSDEQMIEINMSVNKMVSTISNLEIVLSNKLGLVSKVPPKNCCNN